MPLSLKDRGSRLQAFARKEPDIAVNYSASAPKSDTLVGTASDTPPEGPSHVPSRQELADAVRLSMPPNYRIGTSPQPNHGRAAPVPRRTSPPRLSRDSPTPRRVRDSSSHRPNPTLFCGSELGENFMNSGLSTPHNEAEESSAGEPTPDAKAQNNGNRQAQVSKPSRSTHAGAHQAAFRLGENLMMSVVPSASRRALPQMMDGFHEEAAPASQRQSQSYRSRHERSSASAAPTAPPAQLPVREVRIKRLPVHARSAPHETRQVSSPSPSVESTRWLGRRNGDDGRQPPIVEELDDDVESVPPREEAARPPVADKTRGSWRRTREESLETAHPITQKLPRDRKRRRGSSDYDDQMLSSMTYGDLKDEPFDLDPTRATGQNGADASAKLPLKLEQYRQQGEKEQQHMFATMTLSDWEAAGDWFVDQFSDMMKRLRDARRSKRRMVQEYEDEIGRREEAVRLRSEAIDGKLAKMRQDGQRVVEDGGL